MSSRNRLTPQYESGRRKILGQRTSFDVLLGDENGQVDDDEKGYHRARYPTAADENGNSVPSGSYFRVKAGLSGTYVPAANRRVRVRRDETGDLEIVRASFSDLVQAGYDPRALNPNDPYRAFRYFDEITDLSSRGIGSGLKVQVQGWKYTTDDHQIKIYTGTTASTHFDLTSSVPATADKHRYAVLVFNVTQHLASANPLEVYDGDEVDLDTALTEADIQTAFDLFPDDEIIVPIKAYYLETGQTAIRGPARDVDLRTAWNLWGVVDGHVTLDKLNNNVLHVDTVDPTVNDDSGDGYGVGSTWVNTSTPAVFTCTDATLGAAVWTADGGGGGGSAPFADTTAIVKGSADATKLLRFEVDGFTTGVTRVLTPPDYDGTIATLAGAETLANKVLSQLHLLIGGFKAIFTHAFTSDHTVTIPGDSDITLVGETTTQNVSNKTINTSDIGTTTPGAGYFSALRLKIGGFFGIFTHANSADRTYTLPNYNATLSPMTTQGDTTYHNGTDNARLAKGTAKQHYKMKDDESGPEWTAGLTRDWQYFSSSGTWTKPATCVFVDVIVVGGGGGGGSGRRGANATSRGGGGGGGAGYVSRTGFSAAQLGATENVTVGTGGTGGGAQTVNTQDGFAGNPGGTSSFGGSGLLTSYIRATGGGAGGGGTAGPGAAGTGNTALGTEFQFYGSAGRAGGTNSALTPGWGPGGGAGGGNIDAANNVANGGVGANAHLAAYSPQVAGGGGTFGVGNGIGTAINGGNGTAGTTNGTSPYLFGDGGGGGGAVSGAAAGTGGTGGAPGGGGGGGGASLNGSNSGAGGGGGDGAVYVISYCY